MKKYFIYLTAIMIFGAVLSLSSCKKDPDPLEEAYNNADASVGGKMYDKFWTTEAGFDQNNTNLATLNASSNFFRCKQCHAWDGLGNAGSYISRAPKTSRPNVSSMNLYQLAQTKTTKDLFDGMKKTANRRDISYDLSTYDPATNKTEGDKMPDFTQLLTDAQIWDIVKFLKEGMLDVSKIYDATYTGTYPTGSVTFSNHGLDGDATSGNAYYTANCAACHGTDGSTHVMEGKYLGTFLRSKANEVQHKIMYGQPGSSPSMTGSPDITLSEMKDLYKALANTINFPDL